MSILAAAAVPHPPIILPEVGHGEEAQIQKTIDAFREVARRMAEEDPETLVVISPHATMYADYFHISPGIKAKGSFAQFRAPQVEFEVSYDQEFVNVLTDICAEQGIPAGTAGERNPLLDHGTMIPLYFLRETMPNVSVVRIGLSGLSVEAHYALGKAINKTSKRLGKRVAIIASGDLSHKLKEDGPYGFNAAGPKFDAIVAEALGKGDFLSLLDMDPEIAEEAAECGLRSFWIMSGAFDLRNVSSELLSYEGPFGVGYGVAWIEPSSVDAERYLGEKAREKKMARLKERRDNEDAFVQLARQSLETFVKTGAQLQIPKDLLPELRERRAGAFVSLKKDGHLRGCIGTIMPTCDTLADEIIQNAVSACSRDPRFSPVEEDELDELVYSVDVLGEITPIKSPQELDARRYGVIVKADARQGLLLPNLAGVDTVEEQIAIARQKGNIDPEEDVQLFRFEVVRHH